ncbi:hypothetical protein ACQEV2_11860 [Streptomyces sp. CA-251387]|uniref:hypothetical protein n=1 Tax=Streptomyces sp. CA-251387 TaxID=3240064 RepID=UPI003D8B9F40
MRPCGRNCYTSEANALAALGCHPGASTVQFCGACDAWHITRASTRLPGRAPSGFRFNTPASPAPTAPSRWRSQWYNAGAYAAGDAVEYEGRAWLAVVNYTMDRPGASGSWREVTTCMGEPLCAPGMCGPPCHHPACPVRSLPAHAA